MASRACSCCCCYWEADTDSLRRVLTIQRADTARLRTLQHLADLIPEESESKNDLRERDYEELIALTGRLHRPG